MRFEGTKLVMAATDSYRLSVKETALDAGTGQELEAIVPARALAELSRVGQGGEPGTISIGVQENQIVFGVDDVWLTARRIDGQFPNYKQLLPETFEAENRLFIKSGDAGAVRVEINGQDAGALGGAGEIVARRYTLKTAS